MKNKQEFTNQEFSIGTLLNLLKFHKKIFLIIVSAITLIVAIYSFIAPEEFEATASIIPPEDAGAVGGLTSFLQSLSGGISIGGVNQPSKIQLFQEYLKSREVAKTIVDTLKLRNHPWFEVPNEELLYWNVSQLLKVEIKRSGLILITTRIATPYFASKKDVEQAKKLSADIANSAIAALDLLNQRKTISKAKRKRQFIERMLVEKKTILDSIDSELEKFRQKNKVIEIDEQSKVILGSAVTVGAELAKAEIELSLKQQEYEPNSPMLKPFREKVENLRRQYQKIQRGGISSSDDFSIPLNEVPTLIRVYTNLMRDQKILESVNMYLETQKYQEAIQEESDVPTVEPLDKAHPPLLRVSPNRKIMILLAALISSILTFTGIVIYAFRKGKIYVKKVDSE
ncbi:MAG: Wzz/FepE/Etk N-terminal domain-containing protein [Candidatus Kapabacteria bacterium]|nr:Wzz/FepE/Etk N-terminal domain-containing protein [Candidatus Kapabacteria bacterium]